MYKCKSIKEINKIIMIDRFHRANTWIIKLSSKKFLCITVNIEKV